MSTEEETHTAVPPVATTPVPPSAAAVLESLFKCFLGAFQQPGTAPLTQLQRIFLAREAERKLESFVDSRLEAQLAEARRMLKDVQAYAPLPKAVALRPTPEQERTVARNRGYTGDSCSECGNFSMVRSGTCLKCETCGSTTGCS